MAQREKRGYFRQDNSIVNADGSVTPGDRLLANHEPSEETVRRLLDSCAFIREIEDRAKLAEQGLVKVVTGNNAKNGVTPGDGYTYAAQIKNLPTLSQVSQTIKDLTSVLVEVTLDVGQTEKNAYTTKLSDDFITWLSNQLNALSQEISDLNIPDISQLESDVSALQSAVSTLQSDVSTLQSSQSTQDSDISQNTSDISALDSRVSQNETDIAALSVADGSVIGEIKMMPILQAPNASYLLCDGSEVSRTTYGALYALIGDTFGNGNGGTTFNLPNYSGRTIRGYDAANVGDFGVGVAKGSDQSTIVSSNLPNHSHPFTGGTQTIDLSNTPGTNSSSLVRGDGTAADTLDITPGGTVEDLVGSGVPIDVPNPYLVTFVYIKAQ